MIPEWVRTLFSIIILVSLSVSATSKAKDILLIEAVRRTEDWVRTTGEDPSSYPLEPMFTRREAIKLTWEAFFPVFIAALVLFGLAFFV